MDRKNTQINIPFLSVSFYKGCSDYLIYRRNMKNGSMFVRSASVPIGILGSSIRRPYWMRFLIVRNMSYSHFLFSGLFRKLFCSICQRTAFSITSPKYNICCIAVGDNYDTIAPIARTTTLRE